MDEDNKDSEKNIKDVILADHAPSLASPIFNRKRFEPSIISQECDNIILKTGEEVAAKVVEVTLVLCAMATLLGVLILNRIEKHPEQYKRKRFCNCISYFGFNRANSVDRCGTGWFSKVTKYKSSGITGAFISMKLIYYYLARQRKQ